MFQSWIPIVLEFSRYLRVTKLILGIEIGIREDIKKLFGTTTEYLRRKIFSIPADYLDQDSFDFQEEQSSCSVAASWESYDLDKD